MTDRIITVAVPESIYSQIETEAHNRARSVDELIVQTITRDFQTLPETDLPKHIQEELDAMERLTDDALWTIARSVANEDKIALYDLLIERQNMGSLTPEGSNLLSQLREEADALMVRKAHAYALLHKRGYTLPTLDELHAQAR